MPKGSVYKSEARLMTDRRTDARIRQVTDHPSVNHQPFFFIPAYDNGMNWLIFVSHRTGEPQIFGEELASGRLVQLTDRPGLGEWSVYPTRRSHQVLFVRGNAAWRLDLSDFRETEIARFGEAVAREEGMVGPAMGTTALSYDDRWWAVPSKTGNRFYLHIVDVLNGGSSVALEDFKIGHPQFCPDDDELILYLATMADPIWLFDRKNGQKRRLYRRDAENRQWLTHAAWIPGRREVSLVDWPKGVLAVQIDSGSVRPVARFNAWHAVSAPDGKRMVADTHFPDIGLQIFDPLDGIGAPTQLCCPEASQVGEHWGGPFPYDQGPVKVYAPQHTHPHPSFSPDQSRIVFTSDRTGHAQVYECFL